ncbi:MAG: hypothetical protein LM577_01785 [Thermoproteaceae archaeon]|nr:hypothetical protein [Thermoproteaceae archaeon]
MTLLHNAIEAAGGPEAAKIRPYAAADLLRPARRDDEVREAIAMYLAEMARSRAPRRRVR